MVEEENDMRKPKRNRGTANALTDAELSQVEGGAQVATIHLHAEVAPRVVASVGADGSVVGSINTSDASVVTQQGKDGTRINVVAS